MHFANSKDVGICETASESHSCLLMMSMNDRKTWCCVDNTMIHRNVKEKIFKARLMPKPLSFFGSCYVPARQLHRESAGEHYSKCDSSTVISLHLVMQHLNNASDRYKTSNFYHLRQEAVYFKGNSQVESLAAVRSHWLFKINDPSESWYETL